MISHIDRGTVVERGASVYTVEVDGEAVLLDEESNRLHLLNTTAVLVWAGLDGVAAVGDLSQGLAQEYGVDAERILSEVVLVVEQLVVEGVARIIG